MVRDAHGFAAALPWFEAALAADPFFAEGWAEYAATLGDGGQAGDMLEAIRTMANVAPDDPRVAFMQAVLAARGGEYATARSLLSRSGLTKNGVPAALQLDAVISLAEGNADSASVILESLTQRQPSNTRLREMLAKALFDAGRTDELIDRFGEEAATPQASRYLLMLVARSLEHSGDRVGAAPLLARAYRMADRWPIPFAVREGLPGPTIAARTAGVAGNWPKAIADTQALSDQFPASADVAVLAGDAALGGGNWRSALGFYQMATRVRRPWGLTRKISYGYLRSGDPAATHSILARHVASDPENASAVIALAESLGRRGDWLRASQLLDHAMSLGTGHDPTVLGLRLRAALALGNRHDAYRFAALLADMRPRSLVPSGPR